MTNSCIMLKFEVWFKSQVNIGDIFSRFHCEIQVSILIIKRRLTINNIINSLAIMN